jgi:small-conductance mechanosensitive channel
MAQEAPDTTSGAASAPDAVAPPALPDPAPPGAASPAELKVFNRPIVTFRSFFLGVPPPERAKLASNRIDSVLDRGGPGKVSVVTIPQGRMLTIDSEYVLVITPGDAAAAAGITLDSTAQAAAAALSKVVAETKEARDGHRMLRAGIVVAIATVAFVLLMWGLIRFGRVVIDRMSQLAADTSDKLRVGGAALFNRQRALRVMRGTTRAAGWVLTLLVTYQWLGFVLSQFPFTRPWGEQLNQFLVSTVTRLLVAVAHAMPDLVVALTIFVIASWVDRGIRGFFDGVRGGRIHVDWVDADTAPPSRRLASIAVWIFALVMAYPYIPGSDTDAFKGLSVLVGLMVTVGASSLVGQAASGMILMYTRTFRPGEFVRIGDSEGTIVAMGSFTTRMRTGMGVELTIPNGTVLSSVTQNYSRGLTGDGFVVDATVTIGYDAPWRQVQAMLLEAAHRTAGILDNPSPRVFQTALSDFYVEYRLVCQAAAEQPRPRAEIISNLHATILDVFNEHGVQIMSPHYLGDPHDPKVVPPAQWYAAPAKPPAESSGKAG